MSVELIALMLFVALNISFTYLLAGTALAIFVMNISGTTGEVDITIGRVVRMILFWLPRIMLVKIKERKEK